MVHQLLYDVSLGMYSHFNRCIGKEGVCADELSILVYIGCLMQLKRKDELTEFAQDLANRRADKPITWYAMGCFWMMQKEYEGARSCFAFVIPFFCYR